LHKINKMYQFSLNWFKRVFEKSMQLTNILRDKTAAKEKKQVETEGEALNVYKNKFTVDQRISLLINTFT